jgi:hypothetical protein
LRLHVQWDDIGQSARTRPDAYIDAGVPMQLMYVRPVFNLMPELCYLQ